MTIQKVFRYFYRFQTTSNKHTLGARCEPVGLCYKSSRCSLAQFFSSAAPKKLFLAALSPRPDFRVIELRSSAASVIKNRLDLFRSSLFWLRELDLNQRPSGYECAPVFFFCFFCALRDFSTLSFPKILTNSFALHPVAQN